MKTDKLSRRERQIMEILIREGQGTILGIQQQMEDAPSVNAVRTMVQILEDKGYLDREKQGREFVYYPKLNRTEEGAAALGKVLEVFFKGSLSDALTAHFSGGAKQLSNTEVERLGALIEDAKQANREDAE